MHDEAQGGDVLARAQEGRAPLLDERVVFNYAWRVVCVG